MQELEQWLEGIGLGHYAQTCARHNIDRARLGKLTDDELDRLGITPSDKELLLAAIASHREPFRGASRSPDRAERRQVCVLFCDLAGSTSLSQALDPEDWRDVIVEYRQSCTRPIHRYGGYVQSFVGDGILAIFGYPRAHEDDAERAVRAGLGIVEAVQRLSVDTRGGRIQLEARVGIATGPVVIGEIANEVLSEQSAVMGEAPNLAARLQTVASPNAVVVDPQTHALVADRFVYSDFGETSLKGIEKPVAIYQVLRERPADRFEARGGELGPLVGREREKDALLELWHQATAGSGKVAVICGEAGIGKSRLVAALRERTMAREQLARNAQEVASITFQCTPFHTNTAFHPIIRALERITGIQRGDSADDRLAKVLTLLDRLEPDTETRGIWGELFGIGSKGASTLAISSREKRQRTLEVLQAWFSTLAKQKSLLVAFEDLQWIDPSSSLLLARLVDWAPCSRTLIVGTLRTAEVDTARPANVFEAGATWLHDGRVRKFALSRLAELDAEKVVRATAKSQPLPDHLVTLIVRKAEGNPLYLEELTKGMAGVSATSDQFEGTTIPSTLSGSLLARLDHVGPAREVAQHAAVIGREFSLELLEAVSSLRRDDIQNGLQTLIAADLIRTVEVATGSVLTFKHALMQEAAYESLLKRTRRSLHCKVADRLTEEKARDAAITDEVIAEHYARGGEHARAVDAWRQGAEAALGRSAQIEAVNLLQRALRSLDGHGADRSHKLIELELRLRLAGALGPVRGYASSEAETQFARARALCIELDDKELRFNAEIGLFFATLVKGDLDGADALAKGLFAHVEHHPSRPLVDVFLANGIVQMVRGNFDNARELLEQGAALTHPEHDGPHHFSHGQNPGVLCQAYLAQTLACMGRFADARVMVERNLTLARQRSLDPSHIYGQVVALAFAARVYLLLRDAAAVNQVSQELVNIARRNHYAYFVAIGTIQQGWALANHGALALGVQQMRDGLAALESTGTGLGMPGFYVHLAELHVRQGSKMEAWAALEKASAREGLRIPGWQSEIERVRGTVLELPPDADEEAAAACLRRALDIARRQKAHTFALRSAVSYARLLRRAGSTLEAREVLRTAVSLFTSEPETPDLTDAMRLLADTPLPPITAEQSPEV